MVDKEGRHKPSDDGEQPPQFELAHELYQRYFLGFGDQAGLGGDHTDLLAEYLRTSEIREIPSEPLPIHKIYQENNHHKVNDPEIHKNSKIIPGIDRLPYQGKPRIDSGDGELTTEKPQIIPEDYVYPHKKHRRLFRSEIGRGEVEHLLTGNDPALKYPDKLTGAPGLTEFTGASKFKNLLDWQDALHRNTLEYEEYSTPKNFTSISPRADAPLLTQAAERVSEVSRPTISFFDLDDEAQLREFAQTRSLERPKHGVLRILELQGALANVQVDADIRMIRGNYDTGAYIGVVMPLDRDLSAFWREFYQLKAERDAASADPTQSEA